MYTHTNRVSPYINSYTNIQQYSYSGQSITMDSTDTIIGSIEVNGLDGSSIISDVLRLSESELIDLLELESDVPDTHEVKGVMDAAREGGKRIL